ncbi:MAG: hypothetical protein WCG47_11440 [Dermatophilaceae bacterium]
MIRVVHFDGQFSDVTADRVTFEDRDVVLRFQSVEVARHRQVNVQALQILSAQSRLGVCRHRRHRPAVALLLPTPRHRT